MKVGNRFILVLVTAPELRTARRLARVALNNKLVACASLIPRIESHYWWQGKVEQGTEVLLLLKTTVRCLTALENLIIAEHPYETPEFVVLSVRGGNRRYLNWLRTCVGDRN